VIIAINLKNKLSVDCSDRCLKNIFIEPFARLIVLNNFLTVAMGRRGSSSSASHDACG
jgi:hypothetical protein